jgi:hypothetical protein
MLGLVRGLAEGPRLVSCKLDSNVAPVFGRMTRLLAQARLPKGTFTEGSNSLSIPLVEARMFPVRLQDL